LICIQEVIGSTPISSTQCQSERGTGFFMRVDLILLLLVVTTTFSFVAQWFVFINTRALQL